MFDWITMQLYAVYKKHTSNLKTEMAENKRMEVTQKQTASIRMSMLISDRVDFKTGVLPEIKKDISL